MDEVAETGRYRALTGIARKVQLVLLCLIPLVGSIFVLDVPSYLGFAIFREQYLGLFFALVLAATYLSVPGRKSLSRTSVPWYDWVLAALGLGVGLYVVVMYPSIAYTLAIIKPDRWLLGIVTVLLFLEATRRLVGWVLLGLALAFILYARFSYLFPGMLQGRGVSWERLSVYLFLDSNGLMGLPLAVAATAVLGFILFGQLLFQSGGAQFLTDVAMATMGRFRGGPAKMAVVASSLFGTISGSAVSNVVMTGSVTIPLMKRTGYRAHIAGAIEAVASTGGQLMPPVMGVAAFIIAEFLSIPYSTVALAALVPALLYYVTFLFQVDLEAAREGIRGLPESELPRVRAVLRRGWVFIVPLGVLVYTLFLLAWPPGKAALAAVISALLLAPLRHGIRLRVHQALGVLEETGKSLLDIGVITGVAGFIIGVLQLSGLGFKFSLGVTALAGGSVFLLLLLTAAASIILGMGMPTAAVYILLAVLVAPALVQLGVSPLAAHLFVFYFGILSMITPPICLAAYTAAALARADFMAVAWTSIRLGAVAFVVPFLFAFAPELILEGEPPRVIIAVLTALVGASLLGIALSGYLFQRLHWVQRGLLVVAALAMLTPAGGEGVLFHWLTELAGLALATVVLVPDWLRFRRQARLATPGSTAHGAH